MNSRSESMNRIKQYQDNFIGLEDSDDIMLALMEVLDKKSWTPEVGRLYTYIYNPKTPNIEYDEFPLIACMEITPWGWKGLNFHWVQSQLYEIYSEELDSARALGYGKFRINR
jgi:hypothetical protein